VYLFEPVLKLILFVPFEQGDADGDIEADDLGSHLIKECYVVSSQVKARGLRLQEVVMEGLEGDVARGLDLDTIKFSSRMMIAYF